MDLWEFQFQLKSPFVTPWQNDTLFGHLAWAYRDMYGADELEKWLQDFQYDPPFVISNGFITGTFPRPLIPPPKKTAVKKTEIIEHIHQGKRLKSLKYLHQDDFLRLIRGERLLFDQEIEGGLKQTVQTYNTIDRQTGRSLEQNGLYEMESTVLTNREQTISVFFRVKDQTAFSLLEKLLHITSLLGFGNKKSVGFGQFEIVNKLKRDDIDCQKDTGNAVVWLSHGVPAHQDPTDGWYKLETKYGKLGRIFEKEGTMFKRPLTRIIPGALFRTDEPKPYYGRMVTHISPFYDQVVQYGFALGLTIKLPDYLAC
ncbi:type III-A CRISPR-associated RAMP protein Csm4 [Cytobacillus dafuensis]|uniref:CRISPR system Cms protein Csm4 n=1 Tax=Cytobacillus dafuensis TaxID=1742359 RepID=A0A5B8Z5F4_CYTDA|nr:hypothetical protein [Cytobacillus dafuensis]QED48148.1 hypothetical protein FSZ17_13395 [Cytobacillus dafuensis]